MQPVPFGNTGLMTPPLVFGSTALGNLFPRIQLRIQAGDDARYH